MRWWVAIPSPRRYPIPDVPVDMTKANNYLPDGYRNATPSLTVHDAAKALDFYEKGLGAKVTMRTPGPGGKIWHAEMMVGDSMVMVNDEFPGGLVVSPAQAKTTTVGMWVYVPDADGSYAKAVAAGAKSIAEPMDMFWGDRMAQ